MSDTLQSALRRATAQLGQVSATPELDAAILLANLLKVPRSYLIGHGPDALQPEAVAQFQNLIERRRTGEPVAYIVGRREFWSLDIGTNPEVLIPRPETETLVEIALGLIPEDRDWRMADLGTGSGAIALALASERPGCQLVATDQSTAALATAADNARALGLETIEFRQGNWYAALNGERFDLLVSNPPYVAADDPHLQAREMTFEPHQALIAEGNGLRCLRELVEGAPAHLAPGGWLLLEHGSEQDDFVRNLMERNGFKRIATETDLAGHPRVSYGHLLARVA